MPRDFDIKPYIGVGPLTFGMSPQEVADLIGPPERVLRNRKGGREEYREGIKVTYSPSAEEATDFVLFPPATARYKGLDLLSHPDPLSVLVADDQSPREGMGITVFLDLGVTATGLNEHDSSDKTITAFARGRWDALKDQLHPLKRT